MKKMAIFLFATIIAATAYNSFANNTENATNKELKDKNSIEYRVEENNNLIVEKDTSNIEDVVIPLEETAKPETTEEEITTYIENINQDVTALTEKEVLTEKEELTLKNTFITLTDFIFYGGEIKGKTFESLTMAAKDQIIEIYEQIDAKIEEHFPGYKEKIKETSTKTYNNIKEKVLEYKAEAIEKYKQEIGEENYEEQVKLFEESKQNMKESFKPVIDKTVEESKKVYESTKTKLDNWYQTWKEENK